MGEDDLVPDPMFDARGVPHCSDDDCPAYDGKRCSLMGLKPGNICEPAVIDMAADLVALRRSAKAC